MTTGPIRTCVRFGAVAALVISGCARSDSFLVGNTHVGSLKTSLAQLERENQELRRRFTELDADHRRVADELREERQANETLAGRLDNALARLNGTTPPTHPDGPGWGEERTIPAARPARKPPFAQISGRTEAGTAGEANSNDATSEAVPPPVSLPEAAPPARSNESGGKKWLPVITGAVDGPGTTR